MIFYKIILFKINSFIIYLFIKKKRFSSSLFHFIIKIKY